MASMRELAAGQASLRVLIDFAVSVGWRVRKTSCGHLKFSRPGHACFYLGTTGEAHRAHVLARCEQRRALRIASSTHPDVKGEGHG